MMDCDKHAMWYDYDGECPACLAEKDPHFIHESAEAATNFEELKAVVVALAKSWGGTMYSAMSTPSSSW